MADTPRMRRYGCRFLLSVLTSSWWCGIWWDVGGEWCTWCHIFDRFIASHAQVQQNPQQHYVLVKVNYSPQNRNEKLLSQWPKAKGCPHFYVLDGAGRVVASRASGELESGKGYDEARVLALPAPSPFSPLEPGC